jgi:hypothetical protein
MGMASEYESLLSDAGDVLAAVDRERRLDELLNELKRVGGEASNDFTEKFQEFYWRSYGDIEDETARFFGRELLSLGLGKLWANLHRRWYEHQHCAWHPGDELRFLRRSSPVAGPPS